MRNGFRSLVITFCAYPGLCVIEYSFMSTLRKISNAIYVKMNRKENYIL